MQKVGLLLRKRRLFRKKSIRVTGRSLLLATFFLLVVMNGKVHAQEKPILKKISLILKNVSLKDAFLDVQEQSGINFVFSKDFDEYAARDVSITENNITVKAAIELLLKNTKLRYTNVADDQIVINKKPEAATSSNQNEEVGGSIGAIKGRVVDFETSEPLAGATIKLQNTNKATISNDKGYYFFKGLNAGQYTLEVSYVGYKKSVTEVKISPDKDITQDIQMQAENSLNVVDLNTVVVTAQKRVRDNIENLLKGKEPAKEEDMELLNVEQAAALLKLAVPTIYGKVCRKEIPFNKKGKRLYFSKQELIEWIKSGKKKTLGELKLEAQAMLNRMNRKR